MPDQKRLCFSQSRHQSNGIARAMEERIGRRVVRLIAFSKAPDIGRHHPKAGRRKGCNLMPPFKPCIGKAVEQQDKWPRAFLNIVNANAIHLDMLTYKG
jgi:hypothetical protein